MVPHVGFCNTTGVSLACIVQAIDIRHGTGLETVVYHTSSREHSTFVDLLGMLRSEVDYDSVHYLGEAKWRR